MTNPEKVQLIHPPMTIMGRMFVRLPFNMSVIIDGSNKKEVITKKRMLGLRRKNMFFFKIATSEN